jgi:hypothetical protein
MDELKKKLLEDIEKTGFPSELKAARVFADRGHTLAQNEHYIDYDENKGREIDLSALTSATSVGDDGVLYTVLSFLFAEVKQSKSKPWVVFTSEALWSDFTERTIMAAPTFKGRYDLTREDLFRSHPAKSKPRIGRTAYQAFRRSENIEPHTWVLGALKATKYLIVRAGREVGEGSCRRDNRRQEDFNFVALVVGMPLVILDGTLFEAHLVGEEIELDRQEHIVYSCHYHSRAYPDERKLVDIVTLDYLPKYIDEYEAWLQRMADFMRDHPQIVPEKVDLRESL